ncbi:MAG: glycosyltransferase N-terminal domain-containing protein [Bacteroidota bacterium]
MIFIYNLAIRLYVFAIRLSAIFGNQKAKLWIDGRKNWQKKISEVLVPGEKRVWFHCSSLGEFEQGRPVMEKLKTQNPGIKIVLTFFSPSGYEIRKNYPGADYIFYMPADTSSNASLFISLIQPQKVFFTKYEYWHHYFHRLKQSEIPLYMISAIFRPGDRFFKWYGGFFRNMLKCVAHFFVQNEESKLLLKEAGFSNSTVAGDTRFDRVVELAKQAKEIPLVKLFCLERSVLVAGSTWNADEKILVNTLKDLRGSIKLIIAPHEINAARIEEVLKTFSGFKVIQFTKAENEDMSAYDILLIDNIGMLSSLYRYGKFAYVGGGFSSGIHNTLEAAVYGIPVLFGPNYMKFNEAKELLECGGAYSINSDADITSIIQKFSMNEAARSRSGAAGKSYVDSKAGATDLILRKFSA